jgi:hypothetical protein
MRKMATCSAMALGMGIVLAQPGDARADDVRFGAHDVASIFSIAKSENRNQVHYGIRLDERCMPRPGAPVFGYWRMYEDGPNELEPMLEREVGAYGFASEQVLPAQAGTGRVRVVLRALPNRPILVETSGQNGQCTATATLDVAGTKARLGQVFAQLKWPFGVDYLVVTGVSLRDGHVVRETLTP